MAVVECASYAAAEVEAALKRALDLIGGLDGVFGPGERVLLKPNVLSPAPPERAVCTHPTLVAAMARLVSAAGGVPVVGESSGGSAHREGRTGRALRLSGIHAAAEGAGAALENFDARPPALLPRPEGRGGLYLAQAVREAGAVINLPKLKTHSLTVITGAIKNLFGCVPGTLKTEYHRTHPSVAELSALLCDIYALVRPRLTVMDAVLAMEGPGPSAGHPRWLGLILAGADGVAVDAVASRILGLPPLSVPTTRRAAEQGLGLADPSRVEVVGLPLERARERARPFSLSPAAPIMPWVPGPLVRAVVGLLKVVPAVDEARCSGCRTCALNCPAGAVRLEPRGRPAIDRRRCIECLCCQELCPEQAVRLRSRNPLGPLLRGVGRVLEGLRPPRLEGKEFGRGGRTR
ncbi:MAG: DUF362 domain-containing protein [Acetobacteraceae bacterium]|nr:DUF362 domain-containing protein [Acetobacteraceae bacterium]